MCSLKLRNSATAGLQTIKTSHYQDSFRIGYQTSQLAVGIQKSANDALSLIRKQSAKACQEITTAYSGGSPKTGIILNEDKTKYQISLARSNE